MTTAALVLGAAVWAGGEPSPTLRRRARLGGGALGARARWTGSWPAAARAATRPPRPRRSPASSSQSGVPEAAIRLEDRSRSTHENLLFAKPILDALGARAW